VDVLVVTIVHTPLDARIHRRQITSLLRAGHRVRYAAPFAAYGVDPSQLGLPGLTTHDLPRAAGRRRLRALRAARRLVRSATEDVVIVHDPELLLAVVAARTPPILWDVHEDLAGSLADKPWLPAWLRPVTGWLVRWAELRAEKRHAVMLAESSYTDRFRQTHPVVTNRPWLPDSPIVPGDRRVVYLGRVSVLRGGRDLLEVGRLLQPHGVEVEVIGPIDAELRDEFAAASAEGAVVATGFMPNVQALGRLDGALAGLSLLHDHPNYRFSLPTKILEYQAHGLPVITTPLPEAERIVRSAGSGVIVGFCDPAGTVDEILALRDNSEGVRRLAAAGRRAAEQEWSWDAVADDFVATVERVAATGRT
jgi:glycosyltransferase involved in cell wall biosynthesis